MVTGFLIKHPILLALGYTSLRAKDIRAKLTLFFRSLKVNQSYRIAKTIALAFVLNFLSLHQLLSPTANTTNKGFAKMMITKNNVVVGFKKFLQRIFICYLNILFVHNR